MFETPLDSALVEAIKASPHPNAQLLTMNIAMSTATELAHLANGLSVLSAHAPCTSSLSDKSTGKGMGDRFIQRKEARAEKRLTRGVPSAYVARTRARAHTHTRAHVRSLTLSFPLIPSFPPSRPPPSHPPSLAGNAEYAKGSALTRDRTRTLIATVIPALPPLKEHLTDLLAAATMPATAPAVQNAGVESYRAFLKRWGYNERMREAIAATVRPFTL